ncbi:hypothetical protein PTSG_06297 [Salpingoeca rosetta]|uniref:Uncharacterized protein n=1 Tax=Salpingoeca rosetta (strain ATCC 50818 / BSB-021) TaxID=946362 RepID=F2UCI1_SALR5|nr:uncharacterized protein PTSG_06297 [Salpingoeca rosetta]EGD74288.1 hypothetical protein PTSG_06297 [Salpingoeca rosetta]|eukprot:XP_004993188.1 hypothetical protein PTSG_06297 [Salpingoeca rosetta]
MKVAVVLAALALLGCTALASAQQKCKMPQQWEARSTRFDPNRRPYHQHSSEYRTWGRYAYDGVNKRKWMLDMVVRGDIDHKRFMVLELYEEQEAYVTDLDTQECRVYNLTIPFHRHDINDDAEFIGYEILGSGEDSIQLSQWFTPNATYHGERSTDYQTFTMDCVPVRDDHYAAATGFHYEEFSDVTIGISDPNVFIPNPACKIEW